MACRYWCGECDFRTPWLSRPTGEAELVRHYRKDHVGVPPDGHEELRWSRQALACGCLPAAIAVTALLAFVVLRGRL